MTKKILIIETDQAYIGRLRSIIKSIDLKHEYELIYPSIGKLSFSDNVELAAAIINKASQLVKKHEGHILGALVDVRLMEGSDDNSGAGIAYNLKRQYPKLPVITITNYFKGDDIELFGEISLGNVDGVLPKDYFTSTRFNKAKLEHIFEVVRTKLNDRYQSTSIPEVVPTGIDYDIAVLTAINEPEFSALNKVFKLRPIDKSKLRFADTSTYFDFQIKKGDKVINVIAATDEKMGMPASTSLATRLIQQFNPQFIVMLGICAGIEKRTNIGDVIFAEFAYDYGSGKRFVEIDSEGNRTEKFVMYNKHYQANESIRKDLAVFTPDQRLKIMANIKAKSDNYANNRTELDLKIGPFASGAAVIANKELVNEIKIHEGKLLGFDMEAYGVFYAVANSNPKANAICIKAVSDFGTEDKSNPLKDDFQKYAAKNSVLFFKYFVEKILSNYL